MIVKSFEINKIRPDFNGIILLYGKNDGFKKEIIEQITSNKKNIQTYAETEILENKNQFLENFLTDSLFESEKVIIIKRATDKILQIIEKIKSKYLEGCTLIVDSNVLEKKSKLRVFFEKDKKNICVPVYQDNQHTLAKIAYNFFREKKISISQNNINQLINKCNGDRNSLINEMQKIELYCKSGKKIDEKIILKISNLLENHSISKLVDFSLAKNTSNTIGILNENNFGNEDCILIVRTILNKSKKILKLCEEYEKNKNIDLTITSAKPPIFWQDKEIVKKQIYSWSVKDIKKLIYNLSEIELKIKKNFDNSVNIITDFVLNQSKAKN